MGGGDKERGDTGSFVAGVPNGQLALFSLEHRIQDLQRRDSRGLEGMLSTWTLWTPGRVAEPGLE